MQRHTQLFPSTKRFGHSKEHESAVTPLVATSGPISDDSTEQGGHLPPKCRLRRALRAESRAERGVFIGGLIGGPNGIWSSDVFPTVPFEGLAMVP
jgi:hypothetical protein